MNQSSLHRLLAQRQGIPGDRAAAQQLFELRYATNLSLIQQLFFRLYPESKHSEEFQKLLDLLPRLYQERPVELQEQDIQRLYQPGHPWYTHQQWVGMQLYVDLFCGSLKNLPDKLGYLEDLGVNFLHLMPITPRPEGENDGGYAVNDYTGVDPAYGSDNDLLRLTKTMREKDMVLMLDFVVNHTSDEFSWAKKAKEGDPKYQAYYYTYPDRKIPDAFERSLPEVFPETAPGNFTYIKEMDRWVMTVFNNYQWDLNYENPEVFLEMLAILARMVNQGVDVVRFDALAFLWKKIGTTSQNLPETHSLISLFRLCLQVFAPGVTLLAEAIVAPEEIVKYFGEEERTGNECNMAYHASFMALLWNSIATTKTRLLYNQLATVPPIPTGTTWLNYIRCHDDIGLGFDNDIIRSLGWDPAMHRKFILDYYTQRLEWSPAKGQLFMYNPKTGDGRITGSAASLLGLESALRDGDPGAVEIAIRKILMLHGLILSHGGIPMIYAGDELGTLNDYSYREDKDKETDSRWANRPFHPWKKYMEKDEIPMRIFRGLQRFISLRKSIPEFADSGNIHLHDLGNEHIFAFERGSTNSKGILVIANFDRNDQVVNAGKLEEMGYVANMKYHDLIRGKYTALQSGLMELAPYTLLWLKGY